MVDNLIGYFEMAEGAIAIDGIKTYEEFYSWINKMAPNMNNEEYIRTAFESVIERRKNKIFEELTLRWNVLVDEYYYNRFVVREKVLTEDEYDDFLKLHGLMRIKNTENGA